LPTGNNTTINIEEWKTNCFNALNDDLNTPILIAHLFDMVRMSNLISDGKESITQIDRDALVLQFRQFVFDILGLLEDQSSAGDSEILPKVIEMILSLRQEAKKNKDFALSDRIRDELGKIGISVKDKKDGAEWEIG
jgi:cysteinyl-tRNA synthetase